MTQKITLLLVDDHVVVRQGLRALLNAEADMEVVGEAESGRQALALARQTCPAVVVMDVAMPGLNGVEATRRILKMVPSAKVLALSSYSDDECVEQIMRVGAAGYLVKQTAANELSEAIRQVRKGNTFFSPSIAKRLHVPIRGEARSGQSGRGGGELTAREAEVLQLIAEGLANKQMASELGISVKTVEKHRQKVMNKLQMHDTAGLTRYAVSKGVVEGRRPAAI